MFFWAVKWRLLTTLAAVVAVALELLNRFARYSPVLSEINGDYQLYFCSHRRDLSFPSPSPPLPLALSPSRKNNKAR